MIVKIYKILEKSLSTKDKYKIKIRPEPFYSICKVEEVLTVVKKCMNHKFGQRITQVGGPQPVSQNDLANWFPGISIQVPQLLLERRSASYQKEFLYLGILASC